MQKTADVVIIGGGCMGASVAYHLTRRGITNVVLVEREAQLATQSTGRNSGGVRHQFSHEANVRLSIESIGVFEHFEEAIGSRIDFHQDGYLFLLSSEKSVADFRVSVEMQRRLGVPVEWFDGDQARALAPGLNTQGVLAATFCAKDGVADPNGVTQAFARAAQIAGVEICRETEATGIVRRSGRVAAVETTRGRIETEAVVVAAGAWTGELVAMIGVPIPIRPLRRHIFIAQPPSADGWTYRAPDGRVQRSAPDTRLMVIDFDTTFYFHREGANLLFGMGDPEEQFGFDTTVRWDLLADVVEVAATRLPVLAESAVSHAWAGLYEMTPDAMPIIGPVSRVPGVFIIAGFSGHGFQHSPAAGRVLADVIADADPHFDLAPFSFNRFALSKLTGEGHFV